MPSRKLKRSCKKTIKRFHKYIVKSIMRHETSTETCSALQFCQQISQKNDFNFQADSKLKFTAHCFECKHLLTKIEHDVGTNKSKVKSKIDIFIILDLFWLLSNSMQFFAILLQFLFFYFTGPYS